jgi:hypothetical protein
LQIRGFLNWHKENKLKLWILWKLPLGVGLRFLA